MDARARSLRMGLLVLLATAVAADAGAESRRLDKLVSKARKNRLPAAVAQAARPASAEPQRELYRVNAQYRGAVTKGFDGLGTVAVVFRPNGDDTFGIDLEADLKHPEKKTVSHFQARLAYRVDGTVLEPLSEKLDFSQEAQKHREKILQNAPFIYLMRYAAFPQLAKPEVDWKVAGHPFRVRYARAGKRMEATVFDGGRWIGKFFIEADPEHAPPHDYWKFRVNGKNDTVISFVADRDKKRTPRGENREATGE